MKACAALLIAAVLVAGVAEAGFYAHPFPLLRTPRVYNIIVRSDGSLLPSAAYSLPLEHPIFHSTPDASGKAAPAKDAVGGEGDQPAATPEASSDAAPAASSPAPPPALPIHHVAVNFRGATNSSAPTVVATTLPFYSLYHPLAFPISDPTPFIHPFGPHPGYFLAPAFHHIPPAPAAAPGDAKAAATPAKESSDGGEKAKEEEVESER